MHQDTMHGYLYFTSFPPAWQAPEFDMLAAHCVTVKGTEGRKCSEVEKALASNRGHRLTRRNECHESTIQKGNAPVPAVQIHPGNVSPSEAQHPGHGLPSHRFRLSSLRDWSKLGQAWTGLRMLCPCLHLSLVFSAVPSRTSRTLREILAVGLFFALSALLPLRSLR